MADLRVANVGASAKELKQLAAVFFKEAAQSLVKQMMADPDKCDRFEKAMQHWETSATKEDDEAAAVWFNDCSASFPQ